MSSLGKTFAKGIGVASAAIGAGIANVAKDSVKAFSENEQLAGGTKLLFGDAYSYVMDQASNAYATMQMSANDYLEQVNGLSTGLKTALGGDEKAAAQLANRVVQAEADVVAATGVQQEAVQNAFNGIMKSNYTMLDNLQLGITPTKEGFQAMIDSVNEYNAAQGKATDYQIDNLADAQSALVDYIAMQGLAGYAAMEGADTISGSLSSLKAAWQNLLVGFASGEDVTELVGNLSETVANFAENIGPVIIEAVKGIAGAIGPIADTLVPLIAEIAPELILALIKAIIKGLPGLIDAIIEIGKGIIDIAKDLFEEFKAVGGQIIQGLIDGIVGAAANAWEAIKGVCKELLGKAKEVLGIASPSKEFRRIGGYVSEGFAEGIMSKQGLVDKSIADLAGNASLEMQSSFGTPGRGVTINITAKQLSQADVDYVIAAANSRLGALA